MFPSYVEESIMEFLNLERGKIMEFIAKKEEEKAKNVTNT